MSRAALLDSVRYSGHLIQVGIAKIMRSISDSRLAGLVMRSETDLFVNFSLIENNCGLNSKTLITACSKNATSFHFLKMPLIRVVK